VRSEWIKKPVPLYLAADGPRSLELAGELADGVLTTGGPPKLLKWKIGLIERGAAKSGRDPSQIDVWFRRMIIVADSKEAAFREAASFIPCISIYRYAKYPADTYREEINRLLKELDHDQPGIIDEIITTQEAFDPHQFEKLDNPLSRAATQRVVDFFHITGTPNQICEEIERMAEAGAPCVGTATYTLIDKAGALKAISEEIIPRFQN